MEQGTVVMTASAYDLDPCCTVNLSGALDVLDDLLGSGVGGGWEGVGGGGGVEGGGGLGDGSGGVGVGNIVSPSCEPLDVGAGGCLGVVGGCLLVYGVIFLKNFLFLNVMRPEPSILMTYWSCSLTSTTTPVMCHLLG